MHNDDDAEGMDCIHCGLDSGSDEGWALLTWFPVWADGGRVFVGMDCGQHGK